jgi:hypothetical protein
MACDLLRRSNLVWQVIRRAKSNPISFRDESVPGAWSPDACAVNFRAGATGPRLRESRGYDARGAPGWELIAAPCGGHRTVRARTWRAPLPGHGVSVAGLGLVAAGVANNKVKRKRAEAKASPNRANSLRE